MYRAYLAQKKYGIVLAEIKNNSHTELKPFKLLAEYLQTPANKYYFFYTICINIKNLTSRFNYLFKNNCYSFILMFYLL